MLNIILKSNILLLITLCGVVNAGILAYNVCTNPKHEKGICVRIIDCEHLYNMLNTTAGKVVTAEDTDFLKESQCGHDSTQETISEQILVCCPARFRTTTTQVAGRTDLMKPANVLPEPGVCGKIFSKRIYGGNVTEIDEFPWMALIQYETDNNKYGFYCGGSLINSRYALTAGHCLRHPDLPKSWKIHAVRLGEWNLLTNPDCIEDVRGRKDCIDPYRDVLVEYAIPHPNYVATSKDQYHDIALLRLVEHVEPTYYIVPICLPVAAELRNKRYTSVAMDVAGWGATENNTTSDLKLKIMVNIWNMTICQSTYRTFSIPLNENYQLCAGGESGIDTCRGDSGGPLMVTERVNNIEYYFVTGVVSYGPKPCGLPKWPGIYTRVGNYVDWIVGTMMP